MLSGPVAVLLGGSWRVAWGLFALFGLVSTAWCVSVVPAVQTRTASNFRKLKLTSLIAGERGRLFLVAFLTGIATSIYWAFSVDLVTNGNALEKIEFAGSMIEATMFGQIFWTFVGLAGFSGVFAGAIVERLGVIRALSVFQIGIAFATAMIALAHTAVPVIGSGLIFGSFFVFTAATLGMWSLELFEDTPTVGFGTTFLLLSAGQFVGPALVGLAIGSVELSTLFLVASLFSVAIVFLLPRRPAALEAET